MPHGEEAMPIRHFPKLAAGGALSFTASVLRSERTDAARLSRPMSISGVHLTRIGRGDFLLDPLRSLNIRDQDRLIVEIAAYLMQNRAMRLYYDLSDLALIDPLYYAWLESLARALRAINVGMICVGMRPAAAFALSSFLEGPPAFQTALEVNDWKK